MDNVDKVSAVVLENQETLQDIVSQVLSPEYAEDINEYSIFHPYRTHDYSEIMDHWYYFDISY